MKKYIFLFLLSTGSFSFAQSLSNEVIGSTGDFYESGSSLSWTLGEVMTETYAVAGNMLTQGFHQPISNQTFGIDDLSGSINFSIFPNPTSGITYISIPDSEEVFTLEVYDLSGKLLISENSGFVSNYTVDLSSFERGLYLIKIKGKTTGKTAQFKIQKIN